MALPNREELLVRLQSMIASVDGEGDGAARGPGGDPHGRPAVCVIAIDGHDHLAELDADGTSAAMSEIVRRLDRLIRSVDVLGSIDEDRLVLLAPTLSPSVAGALMQRIEGAIAMPIEVAGGPVSMKTTVGVGFADRGCAAAEVLGAAEADVQRLRSR